MRAAEEMDQVTELRIKYKWWIYLFAQLNHLKLQADFELRQTIIKVWPYEGKEKIDLLVPPREGENDLF